MKIHVKGDPDEVRKARMPTIEEFIEAYVAERASPQRNSAAMTALLNRYQDVKGRFPRGTKTNQAKGRMKLVVDG